MQTIAQDKTAVLSFLENDTLRRTNEQAGVYLLARDDAGNLFLPIEGFTFLGFGTVSIGGQILDVVEGRVITVRRPS